MNRKQALAYLGQLRISLASSALDDRQARAVASFAVDDLVRRLQRPKRPGPVSLWRALREPRGPER